jgi:hypothetical protein
MKPRILAFAAILLGASSLLSASARPTSPAAPRELPATYAAVLNAASEDNLLLADEARAYGDTAMSEYFQGRADAFHQAAVTVE